MSDFKSIEFNEGKLILIDQTKLPLEENYIETDDLERIAKSIERLEVRGAPAIGITAAYGLAITVSKNNIKTEEEFQKVYKRLAKTRPTAVNLFWALSRMKNCFFANLSDNNLNKILIQEAIKIHNEDIEMCDKIAQNGLQIFKKKSKVLTHCNTGKLATGGDGTAFNVISFAHKNNLVEHVFADETRPLLQGSRLTAFELSKANIPFSINSDSTAAYLMQKGKVDLVITGADRIAANGDSANKIGTYNLAVLCNYHKIPFYIVAPTSTIDRNCKTGDDIKIEFRDKSEINSIKRIQITKEEYEVTAPAFDVTPYSLISGIITEEALHFSPYKF
ncbi:MAG: S-methyl-5-thioribose-1-phosphate isomerase [Ignavibacteriae bacterium]|nr:MAG: S-methyl-5-thioribose-1-phosphate isomerase [Ignavibacteriota bacterium]